MAAARGVRRGGYANGVYAAEAALWGADSRPVVHEPVALADAQVLVARYAPGVPVARTRSRDRRGGFYAYPDACFPNGRIRLGTHVPLWVVLHELAHALTVDAHGPGFRAVYVWLVEQEMSPWWAQRLSAAFRRVGYR